MSPFMKLHHIVHLRHMLRKWRRLAMKAKSFSHRAPPLSTAVPPPGHLAVYVGLQQERQRFVIKTSLLMHPLFKALLKKSEEELGFHYEGGLAIPCEVAVFNQLLPLMQ